MEEGSGSLAESEVVVVRPAPPPAARPATVPAMVTSKRTLAIDRARVTEVQGQVKMLLARRPAITLGGAFALGILLGRLV